eukprot:1157901-Pelagomonas_calceolata.AAC.7
MGCAGWPKQRFDQAPERRPGRLSSSSPLSWRCCLVAAASARAHVQGGSGKKGIQSLWRKVEFNRAAALLISIGSALLVDHLVTMDALVLVKAIRAAKEVARPELAAARVLMNCS